MFTGNFIQEIAVGTAWSIALTLSLIGWGSLLLVITRQGNRDEWLKATLGVGFFIVLSSLLDYTSLANRTNLVYMALIGLITWTLSGGPKNLWGVLKQSGTTGIMLCLVALYLAVLGANSWMYDSNWDDSSGYWPVCHEMSQSGQSWAPLSLRRALSWGGQYPLQTLGMLFTMDLAGYLYDRSVGAWITLLLTLSAFKGKENSLWTPLAGVGMLILPQTALNSAPTVLSALLLLAMYLERKNITPCAILMAATALTRSQLIIPAAVIGILTIFEMVKEQKNWREIAKYGFLTPTLIIIFCIPAMLLHKEMFNTLAVFINEGTLNKDYIKFINHKENLLINLWDALIICTPNLAILISCIYLNFSRKLSMIAVFVLLFMIVTMPEYSWVEFRRYSWPVITAALWLAVYKNWNPKNKVILTVLLLVPLTYPLNTLTAYHISAGEAIKAITENKYPWHDTPMAQSKVPKNTPIIYVGLQPALLDYSRNKIINWDSFPAVGEPPETNDPNLWRQWGAQFGAHYLIYTDFEAIYPNGKTVEDLWIQPYIGGGGNLPHYDRVWYPSRKKYIDIMKSLKDVFPYAKTNKHIILDMRPEGSPYELSISMEELEIEKAFEREDKEFIKKYNELRKDMEEKKLRRNREREEGRQKQRKEKEIAEKNAKKNN